jgi:flagellar hook-associated protein 1 FlgK
MGTSLGAALSIATGGIANIDSQLALVSQNIANASTPGYATEVANQHNLTAGGVGMGVRTDAATLATNPALQAQTQTLAATVSSLTTQQIALQALDSAQGTPGAGTDLGGLVAGLTNRFSTLLNDPSNQTAQSAVVGAATTLANGINALSAAYTAQRDTAQTNLVSEVASANQALSQIGALSDKIVTLKAEGQSTADLENQRNAAVKTLSGLLNVKTMASANGDLLVFTPSGLSLPTRATTGPFGVANATVSPGASYNAGTLPGIMLNGQDVTGQVQGGQLGANVTLRDTTLPTYQSELDEFSQTLATRFSAQGLNLFTDPAGNIPAASAPPVQSNYVGFSSDIQVNPAVIATPSLVRDGTQAVAGSPTGASAFTPNPAGGPAGFSTLIVRILNFAMGATAQNGVTQPPPNLIGLGPAGNLGAPFGTPSALSDFASAIVGSQAQDSATVTANLQTETAVQTSLTAQLSSQTGVNMDQQMGSVVALQNAYGVNARIISAAQSMWTQLLAAVPN